MLSVLDHKGVLLSDFVPHRDDTEISSKLKLNSLSHYETKSLLQWGISAPNQFAIYENYPRLFKERSEKWCYSSLDPNCNLEEELLHYVQSSTSPEILYRVLDSDDVELEADLIHDLKGKDLESKNQYVKAMLKEVKALCDMGTFELTALPEGRKPISTRFVLTVKRKADGSYDRHKARLVVRGFLAKLGVDYFTSFSPMASLTSARTLIAIAVHFGLKVSHADVSNAFLNAELDKKVPITFPRGVKLKEAVLRQVQLEHPDTPLAVILYRALYGLPNSPALWNKEIDGTLVSLGLTRLKSDPCIYVKQNHKRWLLITLSVDDLLLTGTDEEAKQEVRQVLDTKYNLGSWDDEVKSFLGMNCTWDEIQGEFHFDVKHKVEKLLQESPLYKQLKPRDAPWGEIINRPAQMKDKNDQGEEIILTELQLYIKVEYRHICGCLIYMSITCRSDITTMCNICCKTMSNPDRQSVILLEILLGYLKQHPERGLVYYRDLTPCQKLCKTLAKRYKELSPLTDTDAVVFGDASFASVLDKKLRSTSGTAVFLFGNLISWLSKVQSITAKSSMEAELIAAATSSDEAAWLYHLMTCIPSIFGTEVKPIPLGIDNVAALLVSNHPRQSSRSKHMDLRTFRIQDYTRNQVIQPFWIPGSLNPADHFTKLLPRPAFNDLLELNNFKLERQKRMKLKEIKTSYPLHGEQSNNIVHIEEIVEEFRKIHGFIPKEILM